MRLTTAKGRDAGMATDTDGSGSGIFNVAKGGLFSGAFDSSGLDANVRAVLMDFRWTTSFGAAQPVLPGRRHPRPSQRRQSVRLT
jgi:hypothetical protein